MFVIGDHKKRGVNNMRRSRLAGEQCCRKSEALGSTSNSFSDLFSKPVKVSLNCPLLLVHTASQHCVEEQ